MKFEEVSDWGGLKNLVGKELKSIEISQDKTYLKFNHTEGETLWEAEADCCSESWIEHVTLPYIGIEGKVSKIEEIDLGEVMPTKQEVDELYGIKIHLDTDSWCDSSIYIEFRNSSNGYYGGMMREVDSARIVNQEFELIKGDF